MPLEEAIEHLENLLRQPWLQPFKHFLKAIKLGREALKRVNAYRHFPDRGPGELLPGETED